MLDGYYSEWQPSKRVTLKRQKLSNPTTALGPPGPQLHHCQILRCLRSQLQCSTIPGVANCNANVSNMSRTYGAPLLDTLTQYGYIPVFCRRRIQKCGSVSNLTVGTTYVCCTVVPSVVFAARKKGDNLYWIYLCSASFDIVQ